MSAEASPEAQAAYRAGLCRDCLTEPQSAGRPRCESCHSHYLTRMAAGEI